MSEPVIRAATTDDRSTLLSLEGLAARTSDGFAFDSPAAALAVREWLFDHGGSEVAPPAADVLEMDGDVVGMVAVLPAADVQKRRLLGAMAVRRAGAERVPAPVAERMRMAAATLVRPAADDAYLSRIAVAPAHVGRGLGTLLLDRALARARDMGARRLVLDVADDNDAAIAFYRRHGFVEAGRAATPEGEDGRRVGHLHLARVLA